MICFYHRTDLDGHCSGAIIKRQFPDCVMVGVDYGDDFAALLEPVLDGEEVWVVDFSFPRTIMIDLMKNQKLYWFDHHATSINTMSDLDELIAGDRQVGKAGCELVWDYYNVTEMPKATRLLGRFDVWDHKDPDVLPFQYGMRTVENTLPGKMVWDILFTDGAVSESMVSDFIKKGKLILDYQTKQHTTHASEMSFDCIFCGHPAIAMNGRGGSTMFDSVYNGLDHDLMVAFTFNGSQFRYTLYSTKHEVNVGELAKHFPGGGGHAGAAGFIHDELMVRKT